jgi:PAS domain S-box-containing protein
MLSLENIKSIFKKSSSGYLILYPDAPHFTIAGANDAFLQVTNTTNTHIIGKGVFEAFPENQNSAGIKRKEIVQNSLEHTLLLKEPHIIRQHRYDLFFNDSGKFMMRFWNFDTFPLLDENNEVRFIVQNRTDVTDMIVFRNTEKLKTLEAIETNERRFKALVKDGSDLIAILDGKGNCQYVSPSAKNILGVEARYLIGKNPFDFIYEEDKHAVLSQFSRLAIQTQIKISPFRFKNRDNKFRWIETIITDMALDPAVAGIVTNSRDVTNQVENEIKLKQSIERFNTVSKATSDAIWDWDLLSGKVAWNKGMKGIFGHNDNDCCTKDWWYAQIHPDDVERVVEKVLLQIENKNSRLKLEYRFRCADGTYKYVLDRAFLMLNDAGEPVRMIGSMQDITERINYIKAIEEQNLRLREIAWAQSHLVRSPVARIMGLSSLISEHHSDIKELLLHLDQSARELDAIIGNIIKKTEGI